MTWIHLTVVFCAVLLAAAPAMAQETATATRAQRKLLLEGLDAHAAEKFEEAAELFRAANREGELNIVWLNLGRALQKSGDCEGAKEAYERAPDAPAVPKPSAELVRETAQKYRAELNASCPGRLRVVCAQPDITLEVDGQPWACDESGEIAPGTHTVVATWRGQDKRGTANVQAFESAALSFGFTQAPVRPERAQPAAESSSNLTTYAWVATGLSVALIGTGAVLAVQRVDTIDRANSTRVESEYRSLRDDYDSQSALMWTTFGLGLAAGTAAGFLFYLDGQEEAGVGWLIGPTSVAVEVRF